MLESRTKAQKNQTWA